MWKEVDSMKKTTYLVIISIVTIITVIAGSIYHFGDVEIGWGFPWGFPWGAGNDGAKISNTVSLDEFDTADIDMRVMDIEVVEGDEASVHYECNKKRYEPEINVEKGVLYIKQKKNKKSDHYGNVKCRMMLVVPENTNFKKFTISNNTGDVKITGLELDVLSIDADTGDLKLNDCKSGKTEIDNDTGDVKLTDCSLGDCNIDNDTGDVELTDCHFGIPGGDMKISNDTGDIDVEGCDDLYLYETDFSTDIGEVTVNGKEVKGRHYTESAVLESNLDNIRKFTIKTDIGDVTVDQK